jgi:hypothetical protein
MKNIITILIILVLVLVAGYYFMSFSGAEENGDPGAIRTRDPQIRNLMLYPAELRDHW